jgi:colanic acid biosynthesis glycosyl transferase WcaI
MRVRGRSPIARRGSLEAARHRRQTVLLVRAYYTVEPDAVAQTMSELSAALAERGERVAILSLRHPDTRRQRGDVELWGVPTFRRPLHVGSRWRPLIEIWFLLRAILIAARRFRELRTVITVDTPTGVGLVGRAPQLLSRGRVSHVCWFLDLYDDQIEELGHAGRYGALGALRRRLNEISVRHCDAAVTIGACMQERLRAKGVDAMFIHQWQDRHKVTPRGARAAKRHFGVEGRSIVLYSGHATFRHPLGAVLPAAERLGRARPDVLFVFAGQSDDLRALERAARERGLDNVRRWDRVPLTELSDLMAIGDVHLVSLAPAATGTCVPSKVYAAMAAGRSVIFLGDPRSQVALDLEASGAGWTVDPTDSAGLEVLVDRLTADPEGLRRLGERAHAYFLRERTLEPAVERWRALLDQLDASAARRSR